MPRFHIGIPLRIFSLAAFAICALLGTNLYLSQSAKQMFLDQRHQALLTQTQTIFRVFTQLDEQQKSGLITLEKAQMQGVEFLRGTDLAAGSTAFATTLDGKVLVTRSDPPADLPLSPVVQSGEVDVSELGETEGLVLDPTELAQLTAGFEIGVMQIFEPWGWSLTLGSTSIDPSGDLAKVFSAIAPMVFGLAVVCVGLAYAVARGISAPLQRLQDSLQVIVTKDKSVALAEQDSKGAIGELARAMRALQIMERQQAGGKARTIDNGADHQISDVLRAKLAALASGDLDCRIEAASEGEEALCRDFNISVDRIQMLISGIDVVVSGVADDVQGMTRSSSEWRGCVSEQSQSLARTTKALGALTQAVTKSEEGTRAAALKASEFRHLSRNGQEVVTLTITAMQQIEENSKRVFGFAKLIDDIAFQTNLLALNAGIEAARAGTSGRGFAVVAEEVRGLAVRASEAAKDISGLVKEANTQVEKGASLAQSSGLALEEIEAHTQQLQDLIKSVAAITDEQAQSLSEASSSVAQLEQASQRDARMSMDTGGTVQRMMDRLADLKRATEAFQMPDNSALSFAKAS
ncbi:MAG: hypothetical protein JXQ89_09765 [Pelagimonas sp.]